MGSASIDYDFLFLLRLQRPKGKVKRRTLCTLSAATLRCLRHGQRVHPAGLVSASPYAGFRELRLANRRAGSRHFPIISDHRLASSGIRIITTTSPRRREAQPLIDSAVSPSIPWVSVEALPIRDLAPTLCGRERCWTPDIFLDTAPTARA
ncbi:hypothetical protein DTO021C3_6676 [Paecilomyces variotii]|nr:hypothetical protein DTO021C3_6676 [Paecilomyces variotii]